VREELNRRLRDGTPGKMLVVWLNNHPEVKRVLAASFGGREINKVNLSQWKKGGYVEWLARRELLESSRELSVKPAELAEFSKAGMGSPMTTLLALRYGELLMEWRGDVTVEFQRKLRVLCVLSDNIMALRRVGGEGREVE